MSRTGYTVAGQQPATMRPYRPRGISRIPHTCALGDAGIKGGRPHQEGGKSDGRGTHEDDRRSHILDANRTAAACRVPIVSLMLYLEPLVPVVIPAALEIKPPLWLWTHHRLSVFTVSDRLPCRVTTTCSSTRAIFIFVNMKRCLCDEE